jgi:hypothetical protein
MNSNEKQVQFSLNSVELSALVKALKTGIFSDLTKSVFIQTDRNTKQNFHVNFILEDATDAIAFSFKLGIEIGKQINTTFFPTLKD